MERQRNGACSPLTRGYTANILTRRLNVKAGDLLNEYSIEYAVKRTRNGSFISLA
jgi:hypothetical protein